MKCLAPTFRTINDKLMLLPCSQCIACKKKRAAGWAFRLDMETKRTTGNIAAITLTYNDENLTFTDAGATIVKRDCQLFFKRLRFNTRKTHGKFKYFLVGEYGSRTGRPHYHLILFNSPPELEIHLAWNLGHVNYRTYAGSSWIGYCLKYMSDPDAKWKSRGVVRPFQLHSMHLGSNYLTEAMVNWHLADIPNRVYAPLRDNKKAPLCRYYKDKIYSALEKQQIADHYREKSIDELLASALLQNDRSTTYVRQKRELNQAIYLKNKKRLATGITL